MCRTATLQKTQRGAVGISPTPPVFSWENQTECRYYALVSQPGLRWVTSKVSSRLAKDSGCYYPGKSDQQQSRSPEQKSVTTRWLRCYAGSLQPFFFLTCARLTCVTGSWDSRSVWSGAMRSNTPIIDGCFIGLKVFWAAVILSITARREAQSRLSTSRSVVIRSMLSQCFWAMGSCFFSLSSF